MCLGTPMRVQSVDPYRATCTAQGETLSVDTILLDGPVTAGDYLLVHLGRAIRKLDAGEAEAIANALQGLSRAADGQTFEHLFADLIDREPPLPDHLHQAVGKGTR